MSRKSANKLRVDQAAFRRVLVLLDGKSCRNPECLSRNNDNGSFYSRVLSAHHIHYKSHGIDNSPENGIMLCNLCDTAVHHGVKIDGVRLHARLYMLKILDSLVDDPSYRWAEVHEELKRRYDETGA